MEKQGLILIIRRHVAFLPLQVVDIAGVFLRARSYYPEAAAEWKAACSLSLALHDQYKTVVFGRSFEL
jgi:hypothetical protein